MPFTVTRVLPMSVAARRRATGGRLRPVPLGMLAAALERLDPLQRMHHRHGRDLLNAAPAHSHRQCRGLEPLAEIILSQVAQGETDPIEEAATFVDPQKGVPSAKEAVDGARDIIAEWISEDTGARSRMRELFEAEGVVKSRPIVGKDAKANKGADKYRDYLDWSEPLSRAPSHRILAMLRGAKEGILSLHISPPEEKALAVLDDIFVSGSGPSSLQVKLSASDSYRRLLVPSLESETLGAAKARADEKAIAVFADNLRKTAWMFNIRGDNAWVTGDPGGSAELDTVAGAFFILGLGIVAVRMFRRRDPVDWLLPATVVDNAEPGAAQGRAVIRVDPELVRAAVADRADGRAELLHRRPRGASPERHHPRDAAHQRPRTSPRRIGGWCRYFATRRFASMSL